MNRLQTELDRLYGLGPSAAGGSPVGVGDARPAQETRAVVLAVAQPAGWEQLSPVWRGVQLDLELPAPAIAVSGTDALQLWFSFASPMSSSAAARFLQGLVERYLPDVRPSQIGVFADATRLPWAPCVEIAPQRWSAFVTHDLAAVFADTPWLDIPPTDHGQAAILRALEPVGRAAFEAALERLGATGDAMRVAPVASEHAVAAPAASAGARHADPARFLAGVMSDETAPLASRIEAARILLLDGKRS